MFLPVHNDPQHSLLHLKVLVLPEVDVQRRAGVALADTLLAEIVRLAHGTEPGTVLDEVVQDRVLGRGHGGVVGRGRALHGAGREPLLEPARWHFAGCCLLISSGSGWWGRIRWIGIWLFMWDVGILMRLWAETMAYEGACAKDLAPVSARTFPPVH